MKKQLLALFGLICTYFQGVNPSVAHGVKRDKVTTNFHCIFLREDRTIQAEEVI